jgi:dTDP-4-amino-4,6-dideoxygalactose transaminase
MVFVHVPFNQASITALEHAYVRTALESGALRAGAAYTQKCEALLAARLKRQTVLLTNSATAALEMALLLAGIGPGDEVIMPAFTFVSCANSVALRGGRPVLVDIEPATLNIDIDVAAAAITQRTKAIIAVHYAGIAYDIPRLAALARRHDLQVIEDAAQAVAASYQGEDLGGFGDFGVFSFHHSKNVACGEAGALVVNNERHAERAHVVHQYGTNYEAFRQGRAPNYLWLEMGSSFMPSDLTAALLLAQLERADEISQARRALWQKYHDAFATLERCGVQRPTVPAGAVHNGHIYWLLLRPGRDRDAFLDALRRRGIEATSHYIPLDLTPGGRRFAQVSGTLRVSHSIAERLVRLPLWFGMGALQDEVIEAVLAELG